MDIFPKFFHLPATTALEREPDLRPYDKLPGFRLGIDAMHHGDIVEIAPEKPPWYGFALLVALAAGPFFILAIFLPVPLFLLILAGTIFPIVSYLLWQAHIAEYAGGIPYSRIDFAQKQIQYPRREKSLSFDRIQGLTICWLHV